MKRPTLPTRLLNLMTFCLLASGLVRPTEIRAQMVIVVPADSGIDSLTVKQLRTLFGAKSPARVKDVLCQIVEYEPSSDEFYALLYGLDAYALGKRWLRLIFSGERVIPPKSFSKIKNFLAYLQRHGNSIGFLPRKVFEEIETEAIRGVPVDGRDYRQNRYLLGKQKK